MSRVIIQRAFPSHVENMDRTLRVCLPDAYERQGDRHFPVLYMHDAQNLFSHPQSATYDTWCANTALDALVEAQRIEPWIIVGIDSAASRMADYSPWDDPTTPEHGRADLHLRFLVDELKPHVERTWRVRRGPPWTAMAGSSLGGLLSLYAGLRCPDVYGCIGAFSPSVMWSHRRLFAEWTAHTRHWTRLYLDAGVDEEVTINGHLLDYGNATRDFDAHLRSLGYAEWELHTVLERGGQHHERDWQRRLPSALAWLLR